MDKLERVARAIAYSGAVPEHREWEELLPETRQHYLQQAQAAIAALEPVTVQEPRPISDVPPDGTWAVLHPGHYGAFTACVLNGGWSMCRLADLRFATHWVPCPFTGRALAERGE